MTRFRQLIRWTIIGAPVALLAAQFVRIDRTNPPVETEIAAPPEVAAILRRSCYDCHSNETVWPWYSRIAPMSWLVASDVHDGRRHVNFSTWNRRTERAQQDAMREISEQVGRGKMPLWYYLPLHPAATLSEADRRTLLSWAGTFR